MYPARGLLGWPVLSSSRTYYYGRIHRPGRFTKQLRRIALIIMLLTVAASGMNGLLNGLVRYEPAAVLSAKISPIVSAQEQTPPKPTPAVLASSTSDNQLQNMLNSWAATHASQNWSVVVEGLGDNTRSASVNPNAVYDAASIYKLLITYPLFQKYSANDLSKIQLSLPNKKESLSDCVSAMLRLSDNYCGEAVGKHIGWARADRSLRQLGLKNTTLAARNGPRTSAADTAAFLKGLYGGQLFNLQSRDFILNSLHEQAWRKGIPAGCPSCSVFNKTGDLNYVRHDVAIVEHGSSVHVLAIFTNGASYQQIAQLTSQIQTYMN